ncbi:MAG: tRNA pseudouridine(38-40) synthase TruA [Gammaproteobacteria bacterium]|nr:tRNA pseudouridine(38-40) synthase TruA [Gammaproteobacteria bacterium]
MAEIVRYAAGIEYDGHAFHGWQAQKTGVDSVQQRVEHALSRVADHTLNVVCAGRTDAGVHAINQVVHFESAAPRDALAWIRGANANLPKEVALTWVKPVSAEFHARFSATRRCYRYVIVNRAVRPTFLAWRSAWEYRPLDVAQMQQAANYLIGEHDFSSYRALACQAKSPVRTVHRLQVRRIGELVLIDAEANAFLHHMVRNIAGVLMDVGAGKSTPSWAQEVLHARDRTLGGVTAAPHGLYFLGVMYPEQFGIPYMSETAMLW